jgi:hypothetical protein
MGCGDIMQFLSAMYGSGWSTSRNGRSNHGERAHEGGLTLRAGLDAVK